MSNATAAKTQLQLGIAAPPQLIQFSLASVCMSNAAAAKTQPQLGKTAL